jgi:hypothetical protein
VEALNKPATYRYGDAGAAELMLIDIAVRETGKARCGVSFPMHREDECEIIDRALETHVPERARKLEGSEGAIHDSGAADQQVVHALSF